MDLNELKKYGELMNELKLTAFEVSEGGRTFRMERGSSPASSAKTFVPESPASYEDKEETADASSLEIKSPMVGLFYSSSAEDKDDYFTVGSEFRKGDTICIIEAMKLMNEIKAEDDGIIEKVLVKNGQAVEFGTPLFKYRRTK